MMTDVYKFDISRTDRARDLHDIQAEINADETLSSVEKDELSNLIREKFCRLNAAAVGNRKPSFRSL